MFVLVSALLRRREELRGFTENEYGMKKAATHLHHLLLLGEIFALSF